MDNETKELIQRALKEGVTDFPLSFFREKGVDVEFVGFNNSEGKEIYYIPELDILFRRT